MLPYTYLHKKTKNGVQQIHIKIRNPYRRVLLLCCYNPSGNVFVLRRTITVIILPFQHIYGGEVWSESSPLHSPNSVVVENNGVVLVADTNNKRILMLDANLRLKRLILSEDDLCSKYPIRMCLDVQDGRLLVALNDNKNLSGSVGVYKIRRALQDSRLLLSMH